MRLLTDCCLFPQGRATKHERQRRPDAPPKGSESEVERDFSACGNLLVPNRSRIDSYCVEMAMFVKAKYEHIPEYGDIHISSNDIRACIPARFNGRDTDLLAAEAVIDELENTEIPADGMTMN